MPEPPENVRDIDQELKEDGVPAIMDKPAVCTLLGCTTRAVERYQTEGRLQALRAPMHPRRFLRVTVARFLAGE